MQKSSKRRASRQPKVGANGSSSAGATRARRRRRASAQSFGMMTVKAPRSMQCPMPMKLRTKFTASGMFSIAATTANANMTFIANSCVLPFSTTNVSGALTWYGLTIGTYYPCGFHNLVNATIYQQFIVEKALFEFDVTPQSVQDSVIWTGSPSMTGGSPSSVPAAMTRPWTKQWGFASGRQSVAGSYPFKHWIDIPKYLGISRTVYFNDPSGNYYGEPTATPLVAVPYVVNMETGDNVGLTTALEVRVRVTYFCICRNLNTMALTTTVIPPKVEREPDQVLAFRREMERLSGVVPNPPSEMKGRAPHHPAEYFMQHPVVRRVALTRALEEMSSGTPDTEDVDEVTILVHRSEITDQKDQPRSNGTFTLTKSSE